MQPISGVESVSAIQSACERHPERCVIGHPFNPPHLVPLVEIVGGKVRRVLMQASMIRLSAGRQELGDAAQALCFVAGANSIFYGDRLLTTDNPQTRQDRALLQKLGMRTAAAA